jgi:hypothetical protein
MKQGFCALALTICLLFSASQVSRGQAAGQYPIADIVADKIIKKYQTSSCQDLQAQKKASATAQKEEREQRVIEALKRDPKMRQHFLNRIAGPVVNRMFECGMIP